MGEDGIITTGRDLDTTLSSFFLLLHPLLHCGAAYQAEILATGVEMAGFEPMKKIIPFVTCEISFGQNVCELMFCVNVTDLDFGSKLILSKQPIKRTS